MGPRSATELLQLPVRLNGIRLGRPVALLLEDVEFYRDRSRSLRDLLGAELRDLLVTPDGSVEALLVERDGVVRQIEPADMLTA